MRRGKNFRKNLYIKLLTILYKAKAGHIGCSLSCLDMLSEIFISQMKKNDRLVFSKGHAVPSLYVVLNEIGRISDRQLETFHENGTKLPAHPPINLDESVPFPSGSLGHGLSLASGMAQGFSYLYKKNKKQTPYIYCIISDGECNEGQVWEAVQYAASKKIVNLVVLIDNNKIQAFGKTEEVLGNSATSKKWSAFGFDTYECDGHSIKELNSIFKKIKKKNSNKPKVIICNTIKGYGVDFMENKLEWHYKLLTEDLYKKAIDSVEEKIK